MNLNFYTPLNDIELRSNEVDFETLLNQINKTKVDTSFQRGGGWRKDDITSFLTLTKICGNILSPIYICDVRECLRNATDQETKDYFSDILNIDKKEFLSVDGNNRCQTLLSNEEIIRKENWNILTNNINIVKIRKISKSGLPLLFRYLNSNLKQTNQVMRNTTSTILTSTIIDICNDIKSLSSFFDLGKKLDQEFVARCLMITDDYLKNNNKIPIGLHKNNIDKFYKENHSNLILHTDTIRVTIKILNRISQIVLNNKLDYGRGQVFLISLFMLILFEYRNKQINDSIFIQTLHKMNKHLSTNNVYAKSVRYHGRGVVRKRYEMILSLMKEREINFLILDPAIELKYEKVS